MSETLYRKNDSWKRGEWQAICVHHDVAGEFRRVQWCQTHAGPHHLPDEEVPMSESCIAVRMWRAFADLDMPDDWNPNAPCGLVEVWQEVTP